jgi:hypothetical protein
VWFLIGGVKDMKRLFIRLKTIDRNAEDDGTVEEHLAEN